MSDFLDTKRGASCKWLDKGSRCPVRAQITEGTRLAIARQCDIEDSSLDTLAWSNKAAARGLRTVIFIDDSPGDTGDDLIDLNLKGIRMRSIKVRILFRIFLS